MNFLLPKISTDLNDRDQLLIYSDLSNFKTLKIISIVSVLFGICPIIYYFMLQNPLGLNILGLFNLNNIENLFQARHNAIFGALIVVAGMFLMVFNKNINIIFDKNDQTAYITKTYFFYDDYYELDFDLIASIDIEEKVWKHLSSGVISTYYSYIISIIIRNNERIKIGKIGDKGNAQTIAKRIEEYVQLT